MGYLKEANVNRISETYAGGRGAAQELFKRPAVMVAPSPVSHLSGEYPTYKHNHRCKTFWRAQVEGTKLKKAAPVRYDAWRNVKLRSGKTLHCGACMHERVKAFCEDIERVSIYYRTWESLQYTKVATADYKRLTARIRKHNQRNDEKINYTSFPLEHGNTIVLHDAPGDFLAGEPLPDDRPRLFALVASWAWTPKGKRAGRGFNTWGEHSDKQAGSGGDNERYDTCQNPDCDQSLEFLQELNPNARKYCSEECRQAAAKQRQGGGTDKTVTASIYGQRWGIVARLLEANFGCEPNAKGMKLDIDVSDFLGVLDTAGVDYAIDGEIPGVTDKTSKTKDTSLKRDTSDKAHKSEPIPGGHEGERSAKQRYEPISEALFGGAA